MRWIDELNGITDADAAAREIKSSIRRLRKEPNSLPNRRQIRKLYEQLDAIQFKPDYLCVIIDKEKDYVRACRGFTINGIKYHRLLGTNGGVKNGTIVFVSDTVGEELRHRIENGRNPEKELVPAKLEAYKALTCSASIPVSMPNNILVVKDCITQFHSDIIYIDDEADGEPTMEYREGELIELNESDGYGLMLPALASRWSEELGLDYLPSGVNTRFSWEKGMLFCFDFLDFAENVAGEYIVKDAWGVERDIREVEIILTTSMLKLWDSYPSCEEYLRNCAENHYEFGIAKTCPRELESERNLNYQFIQSYDLSDSDIDELIAPTMDAISDILHADCNKTILYLKGFGLSENNIDRLENDFAKALMIEPAMIDDPYVQSKIYHMIKNRINQAKVGVVKVHGNYSIVSGDPYALCQSIFGLEVTGLLKVGEIYNGYWAEIETEKLVCFRAPMTCHNNIRAVMVNRTEEARYWYRYMTTCTLLNSWDAIAHALNGADKDSDSVMLTDNRVLVNNHKELPAIFCVQRQAKKIVPTEEDLIRSNIDSFGDDIGKITNRITAMFEVQARFDRESEEYKILEYRIQCGQLLQQAAIDRAKGIISKPMPREWYDWHSVSGIEDEDKRRLYQSLLADRKPYFMRYIYPDLMKRYNSYIKTINQKSLRGFDLSIEELLAKPADELNDEQKTFLYYFNRMMPVGTGDCVVNSICKKFEKAFDGHVKRHNSKNSFDYEIMKVNSEYSKSQRRTIEKLYEDYTRRVRDYTVFAGRERVDSDEAVSRLYTMSEEFRSACDVVCPNAQVLCDILLDICYQRSGTKGFVWNMCGTEIIENLLQKKGGLIQFPTLDHDGDIHFGGRSFSLVSIGAEAKE